MIIILKTLKQMAGEMIISAVHFVNLPSPVSSCPTGHRRFGLRRRLQDPRAKVMDFFGKKKLQNLETPMEFWIYFGKKEATSNFPGKKEK